MIGKDDDSIGDGTLNVCKRHVSIIPPTAGNANFVHI